MTMWVAGAALVGTIGGAALSSSAAGDAAQTQLQGTRDATASTERMLERQIGLQEPWRQAGLSGLNALLYGAGLPGVSGGTAAPSPTSAPMMGVPGAVRDAGTPPGALSLEQFAQQHGMSLMPIMGQDQGTRQAYDQYLANLAPAAAGAPATAGAVGAPAAAGATGMTAGSLLTPYTTFKPFSSADFQVDPGYQFRQSEGENALFRAAAANHQLGSGSYLKDAMKFNSGLASQEYGNAYGRYNADQLTGYNQYNTNQSNIFNRLASVAGIGQTATNQQTGATGAAGSQISSNILGGANATAAGQVGSANAINQGIGQGVSLYQQNKMLDRVYPAAGGGYGSTYTTPPNPYYGQPTVAASAAPAMMDWYQ